LRAATESVSASIDRITEPVLLSLKLWNLDLSPRSGN
jgi:hypothetical protein